MTEAVRAQLAAAGIKLPGKPTTPRKHLQRPVAAPEAPEAHSGAETRQPPATVAPGCQVWPGVAQPGSRSSVVVRRAGRLHQEQLPGRFRLTIEGNQEEEQVTTAALVAALNQLNR